MRTGRTSDPSVDGSPSSTLDVNMGAQGPSSDDSAVVSIGEVLAGRYKIESLLGSGGMGRVYRGAHTAMGRPVAIKVLRAALGRNQEAAVRFQREAIASGRLDH